MRFISYEVGDFMNGKAIKIIIPICATIVLLFCSCKTSTDDNKEALANVGSRWEDDTGSISFSIYQEIWYLDYEDLTENKRLLAFGTLCIGKESIPISGIYDNGTIAFCIFGHSVDYTANSRDNVDLFKLNFTSNNPDELEAIVVPIGHGKDTAYFNDGDVIRFVRKNDEKDVNPINYHIYVSIFDIMNSGKSGSDVKIYRKLIDLLNHVNVVFIIE